ncbi:MAG TPA: hypothetical protein VFI02_00840, partial [Armatimonadota bacterium]|nr:hypothetical protein [Armatimonadota bacterium]
LTLGPEGEILGWLVMGPLPNPGADLEHCEGFDKDYIGESGVKAVEGSKWRLAVADADKGLDFLPIFKTRKPAVAYAYATLVSAEPTSARLLLGSDDGVKVWVNGKLVHQSHETRGVKRDEEAVDIRLNKGVNRLLFKVDQHFGGWGLIARIDAPATEVLDILPNAKDNSLVRSAIGKKGALDMGALSRYTSWLRKVETWKPWFRIGITEPKAKDLGSKADALEKQFNAEWAALTKRLQNPGPLMQTNPSKEDYIRVAPGGRYFVHANGPATAGSRDAFFTPIGYNHNPDWTGFSECAVGKPGYDPVFADRFFKKLHGSGVNLVRMMVETPGGGNVIEKPLGTFLPEQVAWIDSIVKLARKYDIRLMVTPWDTFWMSNHWDSNPYNIKNGGPVEKKVDFITKREAIEAEKKRLKFLIERWGNTGTIFAWELLNESDYWWEASPEQVTAWAKEMSDFVRDYEKEKWGRNHLVCISTGRPVPDGGWGDLVYRMPGMDLATTHLYLDAANAPNEPIGPALAIRRGVNYALSQIKDNRPYIDGEDGPINRWIADQKLDDEVFHNMVWAHMASGGAGSGLRWPYRNPHILSDGMYHELSLMSKFTKDVPWEKLTGDQSDLKVSAPEGWVACSTGTKEGALIWVTGAKKGDISMAWPDGPTSVQYRCFDTKTGEWFAKGTGLSIRIDRSSVAVILE